MHSNTEKGRRITLVAATTNELWAAIVERRAKQDFNLCDIPSHTIPCYYESNYSSGSDHNYKMIGKAVISRQTYMEREELARAHQHLLDRRNHSERRERHENIKERKAYEICDAFDSAGHEAHF